MTRETSEHIDILRGFEGQIRSVSVAVWEAIVDDPETATVASEEAGMTAEREELRRVQTALDVVAESVEGLVNSRLNEGPSDQWAVFRADVSDSVVWVAIPESWVQESTPVTIRGRSEGDARQDADLMIGPGSHVDALRDIGDLHGSVNDIYTLVDEGYINEADALSAFQFGGMR
jgi:hypothetical protein